MAKKYKARSKTYKKSGLKVERFSDGVVTVFRRADHGFQIPTHYSAEEFYSIYLFGKGEFKD